jgi:hypothetical protein
MTYVRIFAALIFQIYKRGKQGSKGPVENTVWYTQQGELGLRYCNRMCYWGFGKYLSPYINNLFWYIFYRFLRRQPNMCAVLYNTWAYRRELGIRIQNSLTSEKGLIKDLKLMRM